VFYISYSIANQLYKYCGRHDQRPHGREIDHPETGLSSDNFARRRQNFTFLPAGMRG
jgi:Mn-dependent DtxR family transcriptional regulator